MLFTLSILEIVMCQSDVLMRLKAMLRFRIEMFVVPFVDGVWFGSEMIDPWHYPVPLLLSGSGRVHGVVLLWQYEAGPSEHGPHDDHQAFGVCVQYVMQYLFGGCSWYTSVVYSLDLHDVCQLFGPSTISANAFSCCE